MDTKQYLCIDQKSFYATVECVARGLDPMTTDLVVADPERSENTICLAVSPSLKAKGVSNRCRVKEIPKHLNYITAVPRMQLYIDCAAEIHGVFLKYIAPEDIHTYSIDESFLDVTPYLKLYNMTARALAKTIIDDVRNTVGTVSTCGIGTNLYLAKIALDIHAKHAADFIAELDESDGTVQKYSTDIAVINNMEEDHLDFFKDLDDIINDGESIEVRCQFCNKAYKFEIDELKAIREA